MITRIKDLGAELTRHKGGGDPSVPRERGDTPKETLKAHLGNRERLLRMEERGEVKLGSGSIPEAFWTMPRPEDPEGEVMQALLDERESSR